jgi:hypothetical protein
VISRAAAVIPAASLTARRPRQLVLAGRVAGVEGDRPRNVTMCGAAQLRGMRITITAPSSLTGTARIRTPGMRGLTPSHTMFSSWRISASLDARSTPGKATAAPAFSATPTTRSPPAAFANELTSARNSRFAASSLPTDCLYSSARPSTTASSTSPCR